MTSPSRSNFHPQYRPDIDGLRALAVLPVLAFHAFPTLAPGGFVGVDVFFVISGYLISLIILRSLQRGDFSFAEFYAHRVRRIFPALALVLAASLAAGALLLTPPELQRLGKHVAASAGFVQNFALQREAGYFDVASDSKPLLHLWSLAVEEHFYLLFPLLAWGLWRLGPQAARAGLALAAVASMALGMRSGADPSGAFFWPHTRAWELLAGALLAHWQVTRGAPAAHAAARCWQHVAAWSGLLAIILSVACMGPDVRWPGAATVAPVAGAALLIAAGRQAWPNGRLLAWRPLVLLGKVSYPLYLWHWPLLALARLVEGGTPPLALRIGAVLASALLALLTYRLIELPLRRARAGRGAVALLCGFLAATGAVGWQAWRHGGWPGRLPTSTASQQALRDTADRPWLPAHQQPECQAEFNPPVPAAMRAHVFCRSAPRGPQANVALLGDSHAASLYPGLARALSGTSWHVQYVGASLAPPLWGLTAWSGSPPTPELHAIKQGVAQEMRRFVMERPHLRTVLLASRWPVYAQAQGFGAAEERVPTDVRSFLRSQWSDPAEIFEMSLRATLAELTAAGRRVLFLLDSPELGFDPQSCLRARPWTWRADAVRAPCAVPRAAYEARSQPYRQRVAAVLADFPQVLLVDGARPFCDANWCWAMRDGELLYYDSDHVALPGALLMGQAIRQALEGR